MVDDLHYLRDQAQRCLRLAAVCSDQTVADRLRVLAASFAEEAERASALAAAQKPAG